MGLREMGSEDGRWMELLLVRWVLGKWVLRMGDGWNWLRVVSSGGLLY
jgi:hypothetical protein